jgi:hypothetical protein
VPAEAVEGAAVSDERSYRCAGCFGVVQIPSRRRDLTLAAVRAVHEDTCPGGKLAKAKGVAVDGV